MSLYHSTNYLLVLAILVSPYMPNSLEVIITAGSIAAGTAAFSNILLTRCFSNCRNCGSNYIIRRGI